MEQVLELGFADNIVPADIGNGEPFTDMLVQILYDLVHPRHIAVLGIHRGGGGRGKLSIIPRSQTPEDVNQHQFQRSLNNLLASKGCLGIAVQLTYQRVVQRRVKGSFGFGNQLP